MTCTYTKKHTAPLNIPQYCPHCGQPSRAHTLSCIVELRRNIEAMARDHAAALEARDAEIARLHETCSALRDALASRDALP